MNKGGNSVLREHGRVGPQSSKPAPDITVAHHGSITLFHPLTEAAHDWMRQHCPADGEHQYFGSALAVEPRYVSGLLAHAQEDGLTLQP